MFDTILLLTGPTEQAALAPVLTRHNKALAIKPITTVAELRAVDQSLLRRSRLIAFVTTVIVPSDILRVIGHGAFNFHPGPPDYPGWAPAHFALYAQAREFGVTFHAMKDLVDSGPILDVDLFPVMLDMPILELEELAYARLAQMFWRWAGALANQAAPLSPRCPMQWTGKKNSQRSYQALCRIPLDITKDDLDRRMSIFGGNHFGMSPSINLHGVEFRAVVHTDCQEPCKLVDGYRPPSWSAPSPQPNHAGNRVDDPIDRIAAIGRHRDG
jgi:methionyl-tRNA formyltransferase